jgi:hypothetical protein
VQTDEQLRLAVRKRSYSVEIPDFVEERGGHRGMVLRRRLGFGGLGFGRPVD